MTLDEAIKHCLEVAEQKERDSAELIDILDELDVDACKKCAADHRQLAEWLTELKEAKRLLKSAVKIVNSSLCCDDDLCSECIHSEECKYSVDYDRCFEWKYKNTEEYKKLIGGSENENH